MKIIPKYMGSIPEDIEKYLIELAGYIDGDFFEPGPITFTFERDEYGDDDLYDNADIYQTAYNYIQKMGNKLNIEIYKIPHTFYTEGDDIVMDFILPEAPLDEIKIIPTAKYDILNEAQNISDAERIKRVSQEYPEYDFSKATLYRKIMGKDEDTKIFLNGLYCPKKDFITGEVHGFTNNIRYGKLTSHTTTGCEKCAKDKNKYNIPEEIKSFKTTHPELKYDFSEASWGYDKSTSKLLRVKNIICRNLENHDSPVLFYQDKDGVIWNNLKRPLPKGGCPICGPKASKGEKKVYYELEKLGYNVTPEKIFPGAKGCFSYRGQKNCNLLRFDAYIVKDGKEICVEFDGEQHYKPIEYFDGEEGLRITQENDRAKNEYCKKNKIILIRIPYWDYNNINKILEKEIGYNDKTKQPIAETQHLQKSAVIRNKDVPSTNYYRGLLKTANITQSRVDAINNVLNNIDKNNKKATEKEYILLQALKTGNFKYSTKN